MFFCGGGLRSALSAKTAQDMGLKPVAHIEGGFGAWKDAGGPVEAWEPKRIGAREEGRLSPAARPAYGFCASLALRP